ncbi:MAG TPA: polyphosphate polymerase domain-containing protein [Acetivibrio clariflavus]|nr:polyphosphate polymerase domain-containing protein [Acetivibrio clariflavus]
MKLRHEYKIFIDHFDYMTIRPKLKALIPQDINAGQNGEYKIRSLYFDNSDDKALWEKISGINMREKFRIRCYNDDYDFIKLEKKCKFNGLCSKVSERITKEEVRRIIEGDVKWMLDSGRPLLSELYVKMKTEQLRPKIIVDYIREPFVYKAGNIRTTIDRNIKTSIRNIDILDPNVPMVTAEGNLMILEVKYDNFIPAFISDIINIENRQTSSFSKYVVSRIYG